MTASHLQNPTGTAPSAAIRRPDPLRSAIPSARRSRKLPGPREPRLDYSATECAARPPAAGVAPEHQCELIVDSNASSLRRCGVENCPCQLSCYASDGTKVKYFHILVAPYE